jgi:hypothetical protein
MSLLPNTQGQMLDQAWRQTFVEPDRRWVGNLLVAAFLRRRRYRYHGVDCCDCWGSLHLIAWLL